MAVQIPAVNTVIIDDHICKLNQLMNIRSEMTFDPKVFEITACNPLISVTVISRGKHEL